MAIATRSSNVGGKWLDKKSLKTGDLAKIKTEATEQPSQQGGTQWVCKLHVKERGEAANFAINKPSKNALIDAFGEDTVNWVDKLLTVHVETAIVSGKRGVAVYLVPEGFELKEDSNGYLVISKVGEAQMPPRPRSAGGTDRVQSDEEKEEDIDIDNIPF